MKSGSAKDLMRLKQIQKINKDIKDCKEWLAIYEGRLTHLKKQLEIYKSL